MSQCQKIQSLLLPHVYDLLDHEELADVNVHLAFCPDCQKALLEAKQQQSFLKEATKDSFPEVRFSVPADGVRIAQSNAKARPAGRGFKAVFLSMSVLAVAILTVGGLGWYTRHSRWSSENEKLAQATARNQKLNAELKQNIVQNHEESEKLNKQIQALVEDWNKETNKTRNVHTQKEGEVVVIGPRTIQAGAPNDYQIEFRRQGQPAQGRPTTVRLKKAGSNQLVYETQVDAKAGSAKIRVPADVEIKPGDQLELHVSTTAQDGTPVDIKDALPLVQSQFITHLATDRPMYQPGETVYFRSLTVERFNLKPAQEKLEIEFKIVDGRQQQVYLAKGKPGAVDAKSQQPILGPDGQPLSGIAAGAFELPANLAGGQFTLHVSERQNRFPPEKREFLVNVWQRPRFNKELKFHRTSYGPGEGVVINAEASRVEGGALAFAKVNANIQIDGQNVFSQMLKADDQGKLKFSFTLPQNIEKGEAIASLEFNDGAGPETIVRPLPVVTKKLLIDFYPEGGEMVEGVRGTVYFQARTPLGKPAEVRGRIFDDQGKEMTPVFTMNDDEQPGVNSGRGAFKLTPEKGRRYLLKIDSPIGMVDQHALPKSQADGVALHVPGGVVDNKFNVVVHSMGKDRKLMVGAYCRGRLIDHVKADIQAGENKALTLQTSPEAGGVYRVTVFELKFDNLTPVAERLIYRKSPEKVVLDLKSDKPVYQPGDKVQVRIGSKNEKGVSAPAILMVSAVDLSVLKLADEKTFRTMPTHFLLTHEVQKPEDLEYADFLLTEHPKAPMALDLLLGTQGWRRFAEQDPVAFVQKQEQSAQRLVLAMGQTRDQTNFLAREIERIDQGYSAKFLDLQKKLAEREKAENGDPEIREAISTVVPEIQRSQGQVNVHARELREFEGVLKVGGLLSLGFFLIVGGVCLVVWGVRLNRRGEHGNAPLALGSALLGMVTLSGIGGAALFFMAGLREPDMAMTKAAPAKGWERAAEMKKEAMPMVADAMPPVPVPAMPMMPPQVLQQAIPVPKNAIPPRNVEAGADRMMKQLDDLARNVKKDARVAIENEGVAARRDFERQIVAQPAAEPAFDGQGRPGPVPPFGGRGFANKPAGPGFFAGDEFGGWGERDMRRTGRFQDLLDGRVGRKIPLPIELEPFAVRTYAHSHQVQADGVRRDFTKTLFWNPAVVLNQGQGELRFDLSDDTTRFQVLVFAHTLDGRLGAATLEIASRLPVSVDPKVPFEITATDKVRLPIVASNDGSKAALAKLTLDGTGLDVTSVTKEVNVAGAGRERWLVPVAANIRQGLAKVKITGDFGPLGIDRVEQTFKVVAEGFPVSGQISGMLEKYSQHQVKMPDNLVAGTAAIKVEVFPSVLADLEKGLEGLLREPGGCFEQTSSSNYPNVMILNYLNETKQVRPEIEQRANGMIKNGYGRLVSFECMPPQTDKRGFEWFGGQAPPHESLTAYGLLQFKDMAKIYPVDEAMLERTREYLMKQRDGKGSFKRNPRALDSFGAAPGHITDAYIVWALTETGKDELKTEQEALLAKAKTSKDPYFLALVALGLNNAGRGEEAVDLWKAMVELQHKDGYLDGLETSITRSTGPNLKIETTSLAVLGWLRANRPEAFQTGINNAVKWIGKQRGSYGGYGTTQATVLALKALIAHTQESRKMSEAGEVKLKVNGQGPWTATFPAGASETILIEMPKDAVIKEVNDVEVELSTKNPLPYTVSWTASRIRPDNSPKAPVSVSTKLDKTEVKEGETVRLSAVVENKTKKGQGMTVAILGIPAGLALPEDLLQLKDLAKLRDNGTKPGTIGAFEIKGRELILYWRDLAPDAKIEIHLDLIARLPGEYRGPASRSYLYYSNEEKFFTDPVSIVVKE